MKVKLKTILAGPKINGKIGDVLNVSDSFGNDLLKGGYAEAVAEEVPASEPRSVLPESLSNRFPKTKDLQRADAPPANENTESPQIETAPFELAPVVTESAPVEPVVVPTAPETKTAAPDAPPANERQAAGNNKNKNK